MRITKNIKYRIKFFMYRVKSFFLKKEQQERTFIYENED
jgi:hypothetical protein